LALRQVARAVAQQLQPALEPLEQRRQREQPRAVGGQFDRQRQPVEPAADLLDDGLIGDPVGAGGGDAGGEQRGRVRHGERLHPVGMLGCQPQRRAARRQHREVPNRREQLGDLGRVGEEALDAVEDQQRARPARGAGDVLAELGRRTRPRPPARRPRQW
jgi:hypothetical protein